jgi:hypothetical protein
MRRRLLRGLNSSVIGNAQAFGFSITITVSFGVVDAVHPHPTVLQLVAFGLSGVVAFSILNLVVAQLVEDEGDTGTRTRPLLVGTATDVLAVAAALGCAIALSETLGRWLSWTLSPFTAGLAYVLVQSVELAVGQRESEGRDD